MQITEHTLPGLSEAYMREHAPAVFAEAHKMSDHYQQIKTYEVVRALGDADYFPVEVGQDKPRSRNPNHVAHKVILRHRDNIDMRAVVGEQVPQIVIINSHNGRRRLTMLAGIYRFVCSNGLVVGDDFFRYASRHSGSIKQEALDFAGQLTHELPRIEDAIDRWGKIHLTPHKQNEFAHRAIEMRWSKDASYTPEAVLEARRQEDQGDSLWNTFNRIQENCVKGGIVATNSSGRAVRSGSLTKISTNADFNRNLWALAEEYA